MGAVYDEFQIQMAEWDRQYSGRPKAHLVQLCLLALEREEIVSVAYRDERIAARLAKMPIPDGIRRTIQHALMWAWKDEEMHAIYIRGAILRLGSRRLRAKAFAKQIAGAVGGWSSAVVQHLRWREAPVSRTLAGALTTLGSWTGQVPEDVKKFLNYGPFRDFCLFNIDAERTAAECWRRMADLAEQMPELPSGAREDFYRVQQDEENHEKIFSIVAKAMDATDTLDVAETPATLMQKISAVGEFFVPRAERTHTNPLGHGGSVWVTKVAQDAEQRSAFRSFLEGSDLPQLIRQRIQQRRKSPGQLSVAVKTSFMLGYHRADRSPLTDPALLEELAIFLYDHGCGDVVVGEGRNLYDTFYENRTVAGVAAYFNIHSPHYRVVDFSQEQEPHTYPRGFGHPTIAKTWRDADFRINFGKLRSHPVEIVYLCLGNMEGVGPRNDEFIFAERQAHRDSAVMTLLGDLPPDYALLDAFQHTPDGILGIMGSRRPLNPRRFYGGADTLAVDIVAASHIGLKEPSKSSFLRTAIQWFGDPTELTKVVGPNETIAKWKSPFHNEISGLLSLVAYPVYQFGSGRGSLFLPEMDEEAFPFLHRANLPTRFARSALRRLLGIRRPQFKQNEN
jgi:uncharacterized protein (DUF362 family)